MRNTSGGGRWFQVCLVGICLGVFLLPVSQSQAGRITYVYDSLNRLIRATYDKTTFTYTYDKTGNRLTKTSTLTKPVGTVDFDGDAKTDIAFFRPSTGDWSIIPSSGGEPYGTNWGVSGDIPAPGDYDGDGKTDIALFRPSNAVWYIIPSSTGVGYGMQWGATGDIPAPGDYDGDGKTDIALFRPGNAVWYIIPSSTGVGYGWQWGATGDFSAPGDYDGDGRTDIAVHRPSTGTWYVIPSSNPGVPVVVGSGGDPSDLPITSNLNSIY